MLECASAAARLGNGEGKEKTCAAPGACGGARGGGGDGGRRGGVAGRGGGGGGGGRRGGGRGVAGRGRGGGRECWNMSSMRNPRKPNVHMFLSRALSAYNAFTCNIKRVRKQAM